MLVAGRPDQEHRGDGDAFPEEEQRHQIAGKHCAERTAGIDQSGRMLHGVAYVQRIKPAEERGDQEDDAEQHAQPVDPQRDERQPHHLHLAELAERQHQEICQRWDRQHDHQPRPQARRQQQGQHAARDQDQARGQFSGHNSPRGA